MPLSTIGRSSLLSGIGGVSTSILYDITETVEIALRYVYTASYMKADSTSVCLSCEHTNASFLPYIATRGLYPLVCTLSPSSSRLEHQRSKLDLGVACNILINVPVSQIFTTRQETLA